MAFVGSDSCDMKMETGMVMVDRLSHGERGD